MQLPVLHIAKPRGYQMQCPGGTLISGTNKGKHYSKTIGTSISDALRYMDRPRAGIRSATGTTTAAAATVVEKTRERLKREGEEERNNEESRGEKVISSINLYLRSCRETTIRSSGTV